MCTSFVLVKCGLLALRISLTISATGKLYEKNMEKKNALMKMTKNVSVLNSAKHARLRKSNSSLTA